MFHQLLLLQTVPFFETPTEQTLGGIAVNATIVGLYWVDCFEFGGYLDASLTDGPTVCDLEPFRAYYF